MTRTVGVTNLTLGELWQLVQDQQIPEDAWLDYDGCGSHEFSLVWEDGAVPPPPPAEPAADETADRKMGF